MKSTNRKCDCGGRIFYFCYLSETGRLGNFVWCIEYKVDNMYLTLENLRPR